MRKSGDRFPKADSKQSLAGTHTNTHTYVHTLFVCLQMLVNITLACCFAPRCNNSNSMAIKTVGSNNKNGGINKNKIYETVACSPHSLLLNCKSKQIFPCIHGFVSTTFTHTHLHTYIYVHWLMQVGISWMLHESVMHNNWNSNNNKLANNKYNIVPATAATTTAIKECWWPRKSSWNKNFWKIKGTQWTVQLCIVHCEYICVCACTCSVMR